MITLQNQKELDELINAIMEKSKKEEQDSKVAETEKAPATAPVSNQTAETRKQKMAKIKAALANAAAQSETASIPDPPEKTEPIKKVSVEVEEMNVYR